jgi:hypothetical protein
MLVKGRCGLDLVIEEEYEVLLDEDKKNETKCCLLFCYTRSGSAGYATTCDDVETQAVSVAKHLH